MALEGRAAVEQEEEEEQEEEQEQKAPPAADTPPCESEGAPVPGGRDSGPGPGVCGAAGGIWEGSRGGL